MINFLFFTVPPPEDSKVNQTYQFDDFLNLIISNDTVQCFGRN